MERTKKITTAAANENAEPLKKYRKLGSGSFILNNRYIKPNEVFMARESEIPKAFLDVIECLEGQDMVIKTAESEENKATMTLEEDPTSKAEMDETKEQFDDMDWEDEEEVNEIRETLRKSDKAIWAELPVEELKPILEADLEANRLFNILDGNGKKLNESPLLKGEAEKLIETLS